MDILSQEQVFERYNALPDKLREVMFSDNTVNMLWTIGGAHHLNEERIEKLAGILGYVFLGFIHIEDLAKEIATETNIDKRLADGLAREIQVKILAPVIPEIQKLYHYGVAGAAAPTVPNTSAARPAEPTATTAPQGPPPPPPPATPEVLRPAFAPPTEEVVSSKEQVVSGRPFILHEEQKEIEQTRPRDGTLVRPSFYEGADIRHQTLDTRTERAAARLEIGGVEGDQIKGPRVGRTEEPQIRVVHYTGPQTPVDPFGSQTSGISSPSLENQTPPPPAQQPPRDVHPENVVDLKDLPK